jgi:alkylated DNA repair dioxygenase AlkB
MRVGRFAGEVLIEACQAELQDPERVAWRDAHSTYINKRGLTIVQNHDVYALKLSRGDQSRLDRIPNLAQLYSYMHRYIRHLGRVLPGLAGWTPDELSLHRYDDAEVGLSFHKDNLRFTRLIGILSLEGECTLAVRRDGAEQAFDAEPGDLMLLRGPGLVDSAEDLRPEHAVVALRTPTRTSMMLRENSRPDERIPGFEFDNW